MSRPGTSRRIADANSASSRDDEAMNIPALMRRTASNASPKTRAPVVNAVGSAITAMSIAAIARMISVVWTTRAISNKLVSQA